MMAHRAISGVRSGGPRRGARVCLAATVGVALTLSGCSAVLAIPQAPLSSTTPSLGTTPTASASATAVAPSVTATPTPSTAAATTTKTTTTKPAAPSLQAVCLPHGKVCLDLPRGWDVGSLTPGAGGPGSETVVMTKPTLATLTFMYKIGGVGGVCLSGTKTSTIVKKQVVAARAQDGTALYAVALASEGHVYELGYMPERKAARQSMDYCEAQYSWIANTPSGDLALQQNWTSAVMNQASSLPQERFLGSPEFQELWGIVTSLRET